MRKRQFKGKFGQSMCQDIFELVARDPGDHSTGIPASRIEIMVALTATDGLDAKDGEDLEKDLAEFFRERLGTAACISAKAEQIEIAVEREAERLAEESAQVEAEDEPEEDEEGDDE